MMMKKFSHPISKHEGGQLPVIISSLAVSKFDGKLCTLICGVLHPTFSIQ
jgi:hypothetical protein